MIIRIRKNNRAAPPAVRTLNLMHFFYLVCKRRGEIFKFRVSDENYSPQQKGARYKISFGRN